MPTTTVSFHGRAFEARDSTLEIWLACLADEIDRLPDAPDWLREARDEWNDAAVGHFGFGIDPDLDGHVTDEGRRRLVLDIARRARARMEGFGPVVSPDTLNGLREWGPDVRYGTPVAAEQLTRPADYFIRLLDGTLGADETDARVFAGT